LRRFDEFAVSAATHVPRTLVPALDQLIDRARAARVADDDAREYVAQLGRWARVEPDPRRAWPWWLGGGLALATAAAIVLLVIGRTNDATEATPVQIGDRVAIVAAPDTIYRVAATDAQHTEVVVERGTVTARLFPGERGHRLALRGGAIGAYATGTVYSLTVDASGASVEVHEGSVEVIHEDTSESLPAGHTWPARAPRRGQRAATALLALASPPPAPIAAPSVPPVVADAPVPAPPDDARAPSPPRAPSVDAAPEPAPRSLTDRWRQARLLRGQGDFEAAVRECLAIADARDATWSPIALMEAARIELGPRASPERTISLVDRFLAEWATHQLAPEARELRCRALRQLGRDAECAPPP
jgi:hypothetical protein